MKTGFEIYGKHLNEFDCYIDEADTSPPVPNQVLVEIPFMQGSYDFTSAFSETTYPNREITYYVDIIEESSRDLTLIKILLENWLLGKEQAELKDDRLKGWHYLAKCTSIKENDDAEYTRLEIKFIAYPFKIKKWNEGEYLWDEFCFLTDYMQDTSFKVEGALQVCIINYGSRNITPIIVTNSQMKLIKNDIEYLLETGETKDYRFELEKNENIINIIGNGTIEFKFKVEVI